MKQNRQNCAFVALSMTLIAAVAAGCGGQAYRQVADSSSSGSVTVLPSPVPTITITGSPTPLPSASPTLPPISTSFTITGPGGVNPTYNYGGINTDNILRIRVISGPASNIESTSTQYSNFVANYDCVTYKVTVLGQTITTNILSPDGGGWDCPGASTDQILDFSSRLTPGHGPVSVSVQTGGYDFYCKDCAVEPWNYGYNCSYYCPLKNVYQTHTVTGTLSIQVNGTGI